MKKDHSNITCNNCGEKGHIFRNCTSPRTSIGIILFMNYREETHLLQIQRKDTIGFIDFIRGKFQLDDIQYMKKLISIMTKSEQKLLINKKFEDLWDTIWFDNSKRNLTKYKRSFNYSKEKFKQIQNGINIDQNIKMSLEDFIHSSESTFTETEWGFPKGRRNYMETDNVCAQREFNEETGYTENDYIVVRNILPYEEIFMGSNFKSYKRSAIVKAPSITFSNLKYGFNCSSSKLNIFCFSFSA